jgi:hypothetical protein
VRVRVDQARQQRPGCAVDHLGPGGRVDVRPEPLDAAAGDEHRCPCVHVLAVEDARVGDDEVRGTHAVYLQRY